MRIVWAFTLLALSACSTAGGQPAPAAAGAAPIIACTEPRPEVCTLQYAPACGSLVAGGFRTYASDCAACADTAVAGYRNGPCSE